MNCNTITVFVMLVFVLLALLHPKRQVNYIDEADLGKGRDTILNTKN